MTTIALSSADPTSITADAIIIAVAAGDDGVRLLSRCRTRRRPVPRFTGHDARSPRRHGQGRRGDQGAGRGSCQGRRRGGRGRGHPRRRDEPSPETLAASPASGPGPGRHSSAVAAVPVADAGDAAAVAEGLLLGSYTFSDYKTDNGKPPLGTATIVTHKSRDKAVKASSVPRSSARR